MVIVLLNVPAGPNIVGRPFIVLAYVRVEPAFERLLPCPLLSLMAVTFEPVNVTTERSAGSIQNWHPSMSVGTKLRENGLVV